MGLEDRRATLEAAFDAAEEGLDHVEAVEQVVTEVQADSAAAEVLKEEPKGAPEEIVPKGPDRPTPTKTESSGAPATTEEVGKPNFPVEKAPQAWKPAQKAKWAALDPDVRQEVIRRERETTQVLNESAQARQFAQQFHGTIQPYLARLQSSGAHPLQAVQNLLAADHLLATAPKAQKAQYLAKLINDYGVDILELDAALSGKGPADPVALRVEQLVQQRMAPIQQFMTTQQQAAMQQARAQEQQIIQTVETMQAQTDKFPYFDQVRNEMADAIEIYSRRGVYLSLEQAYNKAIAMDPAISQQLASSAATQAQSELAAKANARAQRALKASSSVGGSPGGSTGGKLDASDRRAAIAAAYESVGGR
jgi:hypothetical protein